MRNHDWMFGSAVISSTDKDLGCWPLWLYTLSVCTYYYYYTYMYTYIYRLMWVCGFTRAKQALRFNIIRTNFSTRWVDFASTHLYLVQHWYLSMYMLIYYLILMADIVDLFLLYWTSQYQFNSSFFFICTRIHPWIFISFCCIFGLASLSTYTYMDVFAFLVPVHTRKRFFFGIVEKRRRAPICSSSGNALRVLFRKGSITT